VRVPEIELRPCPECGRIAKATLSEKELNEYLKLLYLSRNKQSTLREIKKKIVCDECRKRI